MLARHDGRVVLVHGALPGERVVARPDRSAKGVIYADTVDVLHASPGRRPGTVDLRCGGAVLAHATYAEQLTLKTAIVADALRRLGRLDLPPGFRIMPSPEQGYRLRARLHVQAGRVGFLREGSHVLCDACGTGQLAESTCAWLHHFLARAGVVLAAVSAIEVAEDIAGRRRACHLTLTRPEPALDPAALMDGLAGLSLAIDGQRVPMLAGEPDLTDTIAPDADAPAVVRLTRSVRAFFQANRFLVQALAQHVVAQVPDGPVADLYAGVGLFGLCLAAHGHDDITVVEGDVLSGEDLERNARAFGGQVHVVRRSVEEYLRHARRGQVRTVVVDPPRTGLSRQAIDGLLASSPERLVYVSCDPPTLARDLRLLGEAGYGLRSCVALDMFPGTAHVECVSVLERDTRPS